MKLPDHHLLRKPTNKSRTTNPSAIIRDQTSFESSVMKLSLFSFLQRHLEQFWMNEKSHLRSEINQGSCCQPSTEHTALRAPGPGPGWCQGWWGCSISGRLGWGCGEKRKTSSPAESLLRLCNPHTFPQWPGSLPTRPGEEDGSGPLSVFSFHGDQKEGREEGRRDTQVGLPQSPLLLECCRSENSLWTGEGQDKLATSWAGFEARLPGWESWL